MVKKRKWEYEEKVKLTKEYIAGKLRISDFERIYKSNHYVLRNWVRLYKMRGAEGLKPSLQKRRYSTETKLSAVTDHFNGKGSLHEICMKYDITEVVTLRAWIKWYNEHGYFKQPNTGGSTNMTKGRKTTLNERIEIVSHCISNNKDYGKTIERFNVSYGQIYVWVKKYERNGIDGLADRRGKRKDETAMNEVERLRARLKLKEAENQRLRMENELLKKLEALERGRKAD